MWILSRNRWTEDIAGNERIAHNQSALNSSFFLMMKSKLYTILTAAAIGLAAHSSSQAATISAAGALTLTPPGTGSGTDIADFDAANVANDGFVLFNSVPEGTNVSNRPWNEAMVDNTPAYITALDGSASASSGGWANYDDVTVGGTNYNSGGLVQSPGAGVEVPLLTFQLTGSVPSTVTLGVFADHTDNVIWTADNIRIEGPGAVSASQGLPALDGASDLLQFDISGGLAGETYTVYGTQAPGLGGALIGALSFDSIPEPGSIALFATGFALMLRRRRR